MMAKYVVSVLMALALVTPTGFASAASKSPKLAMCDGKKRRPANPYGSILPSVDPVAGTSTPAGEADGDGQPRKGVEVFPQKPLAAPKPGKADTKPESQVPPISSLARPSTERSC
jgi:hypothetical protein